MTFVEIFNKIVLFKLHILLTFDKISKMQIAETSV